MRLIRMIFVRTYFRRVARESDALSVVSEEEGCAMTARGTLPSRRRYRITVEVRCHSMRIRPDGNLKVRLGPEI